MGMQMCEAVAKCDGWRGRPRFCISRAIIGRLEGQTGSVYRKKDLREIILVLTTSFLFEPFDHLPLLVPHTFGCGTTVTALPKRPRSSSREQMGRLVPALTAKK